MPTSLFKTGFTYYIGLILKWIGIIFAILIIAYIILVFFGYDLNWTLFVQESDQCYVNYQNCTMDVIYGGVERYDCKTLCVDPEHIIVPHDSITPLR